MKKPLILILLILSAITSFAQKISISPLQNKTLKSILCNVDTVMFRKNTSTSVILYQVSNPSGSAHMPGTDEVSNKYLIAVSGSDETPDQILYSVGDFYAPKVLKFQPVKNDKFLLIVEHGVYKSRKRITLDISLNKITVLK